MRLGVTGLTVQLLQNFFLRPWTGYNISLRRNTSNFWCSSILVLFSGLLCSFDLMQKCESHSVFGGGVKGNSFLRFGAKHTRLFHQLAYLPPRLSPTWSFPRNIFGSVHGKTKHPFLNTFFINLTVRH